MSKEVETMKKFLLAVAVLCLGTMAYAGPNAGGTLIVQDANLTMLGTDGNVSICGQGLIPQHCTEADVQIDGAAAGAEAVFKVYAAFLEGTSPRLMGLTWGVLYDDSNIILPYFGKCGDFELNDDGWPAPGTGSSVTWNNVQTAYLVPVYWFGAYTYGAAGTFCTGPNPGQGGVFGDDTIPAILDPIMGYSCMGFDMPGILVCPVQEILGACCDPATGGCTITTEAGCVAPLIWHPEWLSCDPNPCPPPPIPVVCCTPAGVCFLVLSAEECMDPNVYHPEWTSCDPNPCEPPVPVQNNSWGQIKNIYR